MGSEIYPEVHENHMTFFSSSSPIFLESSIQCPWGVGLHHARCSFSVNHDIKSFSTPSFFHNSLLLSWYVFWFEILCSSTHDFIFIYSILISSRLELWCSFTRDLLSTLKICFSIWWHTHFCVLLLAICFPLSFFIVPFSLMISRSNPHFLHLTGFRFRVVTWFSISCSCWFL